jgi:hypothetical protein
MSPVPDPNKPPGMPRPDPANPLSNPVRSPAHRIDDVCPVQPNEMPLEPDSAPLPDAETDHPLGPHERVHRR